MINDTIRALKMLSSNYKKTSESYIKTLNDSPRSLQSQSTILATVTGFEDDGAVIFTTPNGKNHIIDTDFELFQGDRVRLSKSEEGRYILLNIYDRADQKFSDAKDYDVQISYNSKLFLGKSSNRKKDHVYDAFVVSFDVESEYSNSCSDLVKYLNQNKNFKLKIIYLESFKEFVDDIPKSFNLVDLLDEIQKNDIKDDFSFAGKIISKYRNGVIIKSNFGKIFLDIDLLGYIGKNIIIQVFLGDESDISDKALINHFFDNSYYFLRFFKSKNYNFVNFLRDILKDPKKEKLAQLKEYDDLKKAFSRISMNLLEENDKYGWFYNILDFCDNSNTKREIFISKKDDNISRIIVNIDIFNLGETQVDITCYYSFREYNGYVIERLKIDLNHLEEINEEDKFSLKIFIQSSLKKFSFDYVILFNLVSEFEKFEIHQDTEEDEANNKLKISKITSMKV